MRLRAAIYKKSPLAGLPNLPYFQLAEN